MMSKMKLQYNISEWSQLTNCLSNNSNYLRIRVSNIHDENVLEGKVIKVCHDKLGVLFAYPVDIAGNLIDKNVDSYLGLSTEELLAELRKFGFIVTFNRREYLPKDQLDYLANLRALNFDKLRVLSVYHYENGSIAFEHKVVAFNIAKNPDWLLQGHTASKSEFLESLNNGSAINLEDISVHSKFSWDWLDYVASIDDILKDNSPGGR